MFIKVGMSNGEQVYNCSKGRIIKKGCYHKYGSRKITLIKQIWMVYSRISIYISESAIKRNMGVFYGKFLKITT